MSGNPGRWLPYAVLAAVFAVSFAFRPLLPVDETRYLTVAWEMWLQKSFFVLTVNFEPYNHKPPLLFWLVNAAWSVLGVSRAAALLVIFAASAATIALTRALSEALFPARPDIAERTPWLMAGNVAFLYYCSFVEFDVLLTVFVLAAFLALAAFARRRGLRFAALAGLFVGLGVLTKGPVMLIHIAWPILLYPLWRDPQANLASGAFFRGMPLLLACALLPVAAWLGPVIRGTGGDFLYDLVWRQAAGRISGDLPVSHARPVYWYLPMLPVAFLPWAALPWFWRNAPLARVKRWWNGQLEPADRRALRLLGLWFAGLILVFSLIAGKQAKYLVPAIPLATVALAYFMSDLPRALLRGGVALTAGLFMAGQAASSWLVFPKRDLSGVAAYVASRPDAEWAVVGRYQGELNFLSRARKPFAELDKEEAAAWLAGGGNRFVVDLRHDAEGLGRPVYVQHYRREEARVFGGAGS